MADHQPLFTRIKTWCRRVTQRDVAAHTGALKPGPGEADQSNIGSNAHMAATLEAIPDLMFELDADGRHWDFRARRTERLVAPPENLLGHTVFEVMPIEAARAVMAALAEATSAGSSDETQIHLPTPMGERWFEISIARKDTQASEDLRFIVLSRDITERKQAQEAVERLAFFDALTDLPNRSLLMDRLHRRWRPAPGAAAWARCCLSTLITSKP
jgi:PAS domain S-box-containing protein